ncbi:MAG TPA: hypothetical protein V6C95_18265 [Coleofasciculaceae cyanobacterium]
MEVELIKEYASRMKQIFADKAMVAKSRGQAEDYLKLLEDRYRFWGKVAQLPSDSEYWDQVKRYFSLMSDPKVSQEQLRAFYRFLQNRGLQ